MCQTFFFKNNSKISFIVLQTFPLMIKLVGNASVMKCPFDGKVVDKYKPEFLTLFSIRLPPMAIRAAQPSWSPLLLAPLLLLLFFACGAHSRLISEETPLISDGITSSSGDHPSPFLLLPRSIVRSKLMAEESCEQTYGFLPCTTTVLGNLFLVIVYGFMMFKAATFLSTGSELLLEILGPGIVGGLFLPILGALPDAMLILGILFSHSFVFPDFVLEFCLMSGWMVRRVRFGFSLYRSRKGWWTLEIGEI